jgi:sugar phosphate permease
MMPACAHPRRMMLACGLYCCGLLSVVAVFAWNPWSIPLALLCPSCLPMTIGFLLSFGWPPLFSLVGKWLDGGPPFWGEGDEE